MNPTPHIWAFDHLADALAAGLARAERDLADEQAVHGLDIRRELDIHPILHTSLRAAGYGVAPEQRFPRDRVHRRRSVGARCDLVITPNALPLADDAVQPDLFTPTNTIPLTEALWLEVKTVAQFHPTGPHRDYAQALQSPVWKDARKLAEDPQIRQAGVLLILFTVDRPTADHDLGVWSIGARARGLPISPREQRDLPIVDRIGNRLCTVALFPIQPYTLL